MSAQDLSGSDGRAVKPFDPRLLRYARGVGGYLIVAVILGLVTTGLVLAQAGYLAAAIAGAIRSRNAAVLAAPIVGLTVVLALRVAVNYCSEVAALRVAAKVRSRLRRNLIAHATQLGPSWLSRHASAVTEVATRGLDALDAYFSRYLPRLVLACLVPAAVLIRVSVADLLSGFVIAATLPLVVVFALLTGRYAKVASVTRLRSAFPSSFVLELAAGIATALVAVEAGLRLAAGRMTYQTALLLLILTPEAFLPLRKLGMQSRAGTAGAQAAQRALAILQLPVSAGLVSTTATARRTPAQTPRDAVTRLAGPIILDGVTLQYPGCPHPALADVSLTIHPGEHLFIIGAADAGKSSLLALLLRFADPTSGVILVGGIDLAAIPPPLWRDHIAYVPQQPRLFAASIADNITLGLPAGRIDEIEAAARLAGAHEFIRSLPAGYRTTVGAAGLPLSADMRQRIALARACYKNAPLLLLDEPTTDLGPLSARELQASLAVLTAGRTVIQVSRDSAATVAACRVLHLAGGTLSQQITPVAQWSTSLGLTDRAPILEVTR